MTEQEFVEQDQRRDDIAWESLSDWYREMNQIEDEREQERQEQNEYEAARSRGETGGL